MEAQMAKTKTDQPGDLRYAETHEWARIEGTQATIGISDYAQDELGDVVFLDLPWDEADSRELKSGERFGDIESVKATSELFVPCERQDRPRERGAARHAGTGQQRSLR